MLARYFVGAQLFVPAIALVLCAFSWTKNALFFTKTRAEVLRGEERCVLAGAPIDAATSCTEPRAHLWVVSLCVGIEPCRSGIDTGGRESHNNPGESRSSKQLTGHRICLIESHGRNSKGRFAPSWNTVISREATTVIEKFVGQTAVETLMMVRRRGDLITTAAPEELVAIQVRQWPALRSEKWRRARRCWQGASWCSGFWDPRSTVKERTDSRFLVDFHAGVQRPLAGRIS